MTSFDDDWQNTNIDMKEKSQNKSVANKNEADNQNQENIQGRNTSADGTSGYTFELSTSIFGKINNQVSFIGKYFDVEVEEIVTKLISSVIPFNKGFSNLAEKKPDLYGPFWIYTTLILLVVINGNLNSYFSVSFLLYIIS